MFTCKKCGSTKFIAHQELLADIIVDGDNQFDRNVDGGLENGVYDCSTPYGPYSCLNCGAEYEKLEEDEE